jgi:hypothetical protein
MVDEVKTMASDRGLQQIIGAALIDSTVFRSLLSEPLSLAERFDLTLAERRFIVQHSARDLEHFASSVEAWARGYSPARRIDDVRLARAQRVG